LEFAKIFAMTDSEWHISLEDADNIHFKLQQLLSKLKPYSLDDPDYFFFEVIRELMIATSAAYAHLRAAYIAIDNPLLSWGCRGLLELRVFTRYSLLSGENARAFAADRLLDGYDIARYLAELEHFHDSGAETKVLDEWASGLEARMKSEGVHRRAPLRAGDIAKSVGLAEEYKTMNKVCSKLVHPTGWSVMAMKVGTNDFPKISDLIFGSGVGYLSHIYMEVHEYNARQGMKPT
jgi:hypothetical protein